MRDSISRYLGRGHLTPKENLTRIPQHGIPVADWLLYLSLPNVPSVCELLCVQGSLSSPIKAKE